jgi:hypothetical protein
MTEDNLPTAELEQIHTEIKSQISTLVVGCETLDMDQAFSIFHKSPEFLMMGTDGSLCDYQTYIQNNINYLLTCSSFQLTTYREEIRVLTREMAVYSWAYGVNAILKTGECDIIENAGASFMFKKINSEWKVVYYHESSSPPKRMSREG